MDFFKTCRGIPVYISDTQKGDKTIILLHGYLETSSVWESFKDLLKEELRVIRFDLPGNGLSGVKTPEHSMEFMADVTADVLDACGVNRATVTGHSMGGYVALAFARKYPDRTEKLCLLHSTPNPDSDEKKANRDREIELIEAGKLDSILHLSIKRMFADENVKRMNETIKAIIENATISEHKGIIACLRGMKNRDDMNDFLASFAKPLLMVFGAKDNYIPKETAEMLIAKFHTASHLMLHDSGHSGFLEEPDISATKLLEFAKN